jgi:hypothetical protein
MEGQGEPGSGAHSIASGQPQESGRHARLDRIAGQRFHGIVRRAQPVPDHERELADHGRVALADGDNGGRRDLEDDGDLGGLGGCGVGTLLDHRHGAEDLSGAQKLEDDVLAGPRVTNDAHPARLDDAEPLGGIALHEYVVARPAGILSRRRRQGVDLPSREPGEDPVRLERLRARDRPHLHKSAAVSLAMSRSME